MILYIIASISVFFFFIIGGCIWSQMGEKLHICSAFFLFSFLVFFSGLEGAFLTFLVMRWWEVLGAGSKLDGDSGSSAVVQSHTNTCTRRYQWIIDPGNRYLSSKSSSLLNVQ